MLPEFFPSGLSGLYDKLKVPFLYYMPYWCMDNNTARTDQWQFITPQDCGWECQFTFVRGNQSEAFHTELFTKYKPLGMSNYEQDFMVSRTMLRSSLGVAPKHSSRIIVWTGDELCKNESVQH